MADPGAGRTCAGGIDGRARDDWLVADGGRRDARSSRAACRFALAPRGAGAGRGTNRARGSAAENAARARLGRERATSPVVGRPPWPTVPGNRVCLGPVRQIDPSRHHATAGSSFCPECIPRTWHPACARPACARRVARSCCLRCRDVGNLGSAAICSSAKGWQTAGLVRHAESSTRSTTIRVSDRPQASTAGRHWTRADQLPRRKQRPQANVCSGILSAT